MFFILWIFFLRLGLGKCGGYQTIIRKPRKRDRRYVFFIIYTSVILFSAFSVTSIVFMAKDAKVNRMASDDLMDKNRQQVNLL